MFSIDISRKIEFSSPNKIDEQSNLTNIKTTLNIIDKKKSDINLIMNICCDDMADYSLSQRPAKYSKLVKTELER
jgi:hypothetical protein